MITLYTIHCPSCKVLEMKLKKKNINFTVIDDKEIVTNFGLENGIKSAPILVVDDTVMNLTQANAWVNQQ